MQKKFLLGPALTIGLIAFLLILHFTGVFTLPFLPPAGAQPPGGGEPPEWWYQCADGTWVGDLSACPGGGALSQQPASEEDCGSVDNTHLLANPDEQTEAEKAAIACFNEKMVNCAEGNLELTGDNGGTYSVKGSADENCMISFYSASTNEEKTCAIPASFIAEDIAAAEDAAKPEMMLVMLGFSISFESYTDTRTNEKTVLSCAKQQNI